jgi:hypothetical protein
MKELRGASREVKCTRIGLNQPGNPAVVFGSINPRRNVSAGLTFETSDLKPSTESGRWSKTPTLNA